MLIKREGYWGLDNQLSAYTEAEIRSITRQAAEVGLVPFVEKRWDGTGWGRAPQITICWGTPALEGKAGDTSWHRIVSLDVFLMDQKLVPPLWLRAIFG